MMAQSKLEHYPSKDVNTPNRKPIKHILMGSADVVTSTIHHLQVTVLRTLQAANIAGIKAILVHAISQEAKQFYERCGFIASPVAPMTLMVTVKDE